MIFSNTCHHLLQKITRVCAFRCKSTIHFLMESDFFDGGYFGWGGGEFKWQLTSHLLASFFNDREGGELFCIFDKISGLLFVSSFNFFFFFKIPIFPFPFEWKKPYRAGSLHIQHSGDTKNKYTFSFQKSFFKRKNW